MADTPHNEPSDDEVGPADGDPLLREVEPLELGELVNPSTFLDLLGDAFRDVAGDLLARLPWLLVGLAAIGLVGLALAFALQNILENQISGVLILTRKPFVRGDLIVTNDYEGYVEDIDLRVTTLREHDGKTTLVPNAHVLTNSLTNFTRRGTRRTTVTLGVDYRDDHDHATRVLHAALIGVEGVLGDPAHEVLLVGFGDSSIDFEVRFWTDADNKTVRQTRHRVISACKHALDDAGMTIPWPIRTLAADRDPLELRPDTALLSNGDAAHKSSTAEVARDQT